MKGKTLDVGSRDINGSPRELFHEYIGIDSLKGKNVDMRASAHALPFMDSEFDNVLCLDMLEHDPTFWLSIPEMIRVLRPGGNLVIAVPGIGFHKHNYPSDFWRFTEEAMTMLLKEMQVLSVEENDAIVLAHARKPSHSVAGVRPVIAAFIKEINPRRYLEIGLGDGRNFASVPVMEKVCISPSGHVEPPAKLYKGLSNDIFKNFPEAPFDLIFIDGDHRYAQVMRDIYRSMCFLCSEGVILVHDVNPLDRPDYVSDPVRPPGGKPWCGDAWKAVLHVKFHIRELGMAVIREFPGWLVLWRASHIRRPGAMFKPGQRKTSIANLDINFARSHRHLFDFTNLENALRAYREDMELQAC